MKNRLVAAVVASLSLVAVQALAAPRLLPGDPAAGAPPDRCGTPAPSIAEMDQVQEAIGQYMARVGPTVNGGQIKVAWHVIYSGSTGNIPQSQIDAQIAELNAAYASTGYSFVLASVDRTNNSGWFTMTPNSSKERNAKRALATNVAQRLNIYSCKPGQNLLGWAYFPNSYPESDYRHGVVIHYGSVPGGYLAPYNLGGTCDHEVGHYLGLYHTFQNGCSSPGDYVDDTPYEASANYGCPASRNTCTSPGDDPIHNYMDYSDDICYTHFTAGQRARMDAIVPVYRPSLLNAAARASDLEAEPPAVVVEAGAVSFRGAFPNPFRDQTRLRFSLPRGEHVSLKVFNVAGQLVETLADGAMPAGEHGLTLRSTGLRPGMYFASLRVGGAVVNRSVLLVR